MCLAIFENTNPILSCVSPGLEVSPSFESTNVLEVCDGVFSFFSRSVVFSDSAGMVLDSVEALMAGEKSCNVSLVILKIATYFQ